MPIDLHHVVDGPADAPVLVMSHSLGASLATWEPQARALASRFRVVRYDLRGHGRSPVPRGPYDISELGNDLLALLDAVGASRAHLCGLSLGGVVSLWVALHHPTRVQRLVVCCTSASFGRSKAWRKRAALVRALGTAAIADSVVERWLTPMYRAAHPAMSSELAAIVAATPIDGYAGCCAAIAGMDLGPRLSAIRVPTLAIAATEDPETPPAHLAGIASAIPRCRMALVSRAAHLANLEQPETITDLIARHLED